VLFDLRKDMNDLKGIVFGMIQNGGNADVLSGVMNNMNNTNEHLSNINTQFYNAQPTTPVNLQTPITPVNHVIEINEAIPVNESLSIEEKEIELIRKALQKFNGRRKKAAQELGISERTLYRKIKQYDLE